MSGVLDSAVSAMSGAARKTEISALNIANVSTPGFKRLRRPSDARAAEPFADALSRVGADLSPGKMIETGRPLDLAINGPGYFQLRAGDRIVYSRQGGFTRNTDGLLVTPQGYVLQQAGGGDVVVTSTAAVSADGTVMDGDRPVGRIAVFQAPVDAGMRPLDGSLFSMAEGAADEVGAPSIRTGALEASNVSLGDEMIGTMGAMRDAETGAKLVQVYDDLIGKAIQAFGQVR